MGGKGKNGGIKIEWDRRNINGIDVTFKWNAAPNIRPNSNDHLIPRYTWDDVTLVTRAAGDLENESWQQWEDDDKIKLIKLICKVKGKTYKETKPIKDIKITAKDIRLLAEKVLGIDVITENIKF
tara:strand:+ start:5614 stop:5988 length:375 start_codon:yes stop_codon:yes gene_type:complete